MRLRRLLSTLAAVAMAALSPVVAQPAAAAETAEPVRIMPLGDSITGAPGCWRALLWNQLQDAGYTDIDMVGTLPAQYCGVDHDGDNEGHAGMLVTEAAEQNLLPGWLAATSPDIVLMHFGTNDVWGAVPAERIIDAYTTLVEQMRASNPTMTVLVAQILPMNPWQCGDCGQRVQELNALIPQWAESVTTEESPVVVVDQWTGFDTATDTYDGVHPNGGGDQKIADRWFAELTRHLPQS